MNVLDLFSGIGGFSLGLERAGMRTVAFCESEGYCQRILADHWQTVPCYPDIRTLTADVLAADGIAADVICGGFPCQDISVAGKGVGLAGARSGLWREYHRLIRELRPRYVIVENVAALLSRGLGEVLADLAEIRYDAEWHCIPASYVGAPHRRDRVWIVAYPQSGTRQRQALRESGHAALSREDMAYPGIDRCLRGGIAEHAEQQGPSGDQPDGCGEERRRQRPDVADAEHGGRSGWVEEGRRSGSAMSHGWWESEPDVRGVSDGTAARLDGGLNGREGMDTVESTARLPEVSLRVVWRDITARAASQGSQQDEQLARELADRVPELPHALALAGGQGSMEAATRFMRRMRQALAALGALSDASQPTVAAWLALSGEEAERAFLAACGRADWSAGEWLGVGRVAHAIPKRVDRLRALGNAVVPQVVEIIGRAIMRAES